MWAGATGGTVSAVLWPLLWWLGGPVDLDALALALGDLHRRHQALHAAYVGAVAGVPDDPGEPAILVLPDAADDATARAAVLDALLRPLALDRGEVWRAAWARSAGTGRLAFRIVLHHIAFDRRSQAPPPARLRHPGTGGPPRYRRPRPDHHVPRRRGVPADVRPRRGPPRWRGPCRRPGTGRAGRAVRRGGADPERGGAAVVAVVRAAGRSGSGARAARLPYRVRPGRAADRLGRPVLHPAAAGRHPAVDRGRRPHRPGTGRGRGRGGRGLPPGHRGGTGRPDVDLGRLYPLQGV